jgi:hypothetical protein
MMPDSALSSPLRVTPVLWIGAVTIGLIAIAAVALWAYYGTTVFFETIAAGLAACF